MEAYLSGVLNCKNELLDWGLFKAGLILRWGLIQGFTLLIFQANDSGKIMLHFYLGILSLLPSDVMWLFCL